MSEQPDTRTVLDALSRRIGEISPQWQEALGAQLADDQIDALYSSELDDPRHAAVEMIREGWLMHRKRSRIAPAAEPDLALLIGDWCFAQGLCQIAEHGSLEDVRQLSQLIAELSVRPEQSVEQLSVYWNNTIEAMQDV